MTRRILHIALPVIVLQFSYFAFYKVCYAYSAELLWISILLPLTPGSTFSMQRFLVPVLFLTVILRGLLEKIKIPALTFILVITFRNILPLDHFSPA